ncbi:MAG: NAD+ synthase [Deltaproteobacteria bacterium]|nr:NAD+ synthase [Deltaproteobacteria bacterium]
MRIALGQINPTVGDFDGNRRSIEEALLAAESGGADLLVLPELALAGYPPKDLLERSGFLAAAQDSLTQLTARVAGRTAVLVGFPEVLSNAPVGRRVANAAALIDGGQVVAICRKSLLPTYDVFDEWRYFEPSTEAKVVDFRGRRLGISICEDIWNDIDFWPHRLYREDPIERLVKAGADLVVNIAASPFTMEKRSLRPRMLAATARRWCVPLVFVNQVGGQDDLVFDGSSAAFDNRGAVVAQARELATDLVIVDVAVEANPDRSNGDRADLSVNPVGRSATTDEQAAFDALVLGTRDYARRCGFSQALLGLSGGIDSALVACIAAEALGPKNVLGVAMPSRFSSTASEVDARTLAASLGISFDTLSIEPMFAAYLTELGPLYARVGAPDVPGVPDLAAENLQARVRGAILMALSNRTGRLLLTTGNKSEIATGYCTLYGDMAGGLAVISDVPKTLVYRLARTINDTHGAKNGVGVGAGVGLIPASTMLKAPSAELRPNQTDQDSLPPYDLLDAILEAHLEQGLDSAALAAAGFPRAVVDDVVRRVRLSEYKRRQMPPGLKITGKAFGPGRRMPIAQAWKG